MQTFEELSVFEIAALTENQLNNYVEIALMLQGIVVPPQPLEPVLLAVPELNPVGTLFKVRPKGTHWDIYFLDREAGFEAAQIKGAVNTDTVYAGGTSYLCLGETYEHLKQCECAPVDYYDTATVRAAKEALDENERRRKAHKKALDDWNDSTEGAQAVRSEIIEKFYQAREKVRGLEDVLSTREKYLRLANNDSEVAGKFLANAYCDNTIREALEYAEWTQNKAVAA